MSDAERNFTEDEWLHGDVPEPCPQGCGRTTDDVAGGPCSTCWAALDDEDSTGQEKAT